MNCTTCIPVVTCITVCDMCESRSLTYSIVLFIYIVDYLILYILGINVKKIIIK